ncbi:MAG TPA: NUDIX hydrolase [Candidatus Binataceae bacterium]|nr:NUDIX hydrolase [Candidatus Binataceae bacterium]
MEDRFWVGVHGVLVERGRLLVLKRAPTMSYRPGSWDLPGGHLAEREDFELCLAREIEEETGLVAHPSRFLCVHKSEGPYMQLLYECAIEGGPRQIRLRPNEHVEAGWASLAELSRLDLIPYLAAILRRGILDEFVR